MTPSEPKLYHITHVDNLASVLADGGLWCDATLLARNDGPVTSIGMGGIKARRLTLPVKCHPGDTVGEYVPFYFCPRSIMLYLIYMANHPNLAYRGGQVPILHLEFDLDAVLAWADAQPKRWAFTLSNAGAPYAEFRATRGQLVEVDWAAVQATDFRSAEIKEGKQAEFLVQEFVPWHLVRRVGTINDTVQRQAVRAIGGAAHRPPVEVCRGWYY
ncbi:MAG: DUF4433 domain-containing protein [Burkholderiales bacterium]|jgi:hypothetical protein|nr:DUF4433 domain-containing protein [Burkholderiales bacterium]